MTAADSVSERGEEERRRLARELHDDIGQRLALLADDADRLRRELKLTDDANRHRLDNLVEQARHLSEDLRRISHTLHPAIIEDLGLVPALRSLVDQFRDRSGQVIDFVVKWNAAGELPLILSTALYRITQEALRNVDKHADAKCVQVKLERQLGQVVLVISDDGRGFGKDKPAGLGLTSMRERADLAGGDLLVTSTPKKGTAVRVSLPFVVGHATQRPH